MQNTEGNTFTVEYQNQTIERLGTLVGLLMQNRERNAAEYVSWQDEIGDVAIFHEEIKALMNDPTDLVTTFSL